MRSRLTYANVMATVAVFLALGGSSYAALVITGRQVKNGSLTGADIKNSSLGGIDVKDGSLRAHDFQAGDLPRGPQGPPGSDAQFNGAAAGGVLAGTYPNPGLGSNVVTGANVDESTLGSVPSADNAASLGGVAASQFPQNLATGPHAGGFNVYSYFVDTSTTSTLPIGQVALETIGIAGDVKLCGDTGSSDTEPYVAYVNGTRSTGTISGISCSGAFNVGAGGDFEFRVRRADIVGVHSGDSTTNKNYEALGFSAL